MSETNKRFSAGICVYVCDCPCVVWNEKMHTEHAGRVLSTRERSRQRENEKEAERNKKDSKTNTRIVGTLSYHLYVNVIPSITHKVHRTCIRYIQRKNLYL